MIFHRALLFLYILSSEKYKMDRRLLYLFMAAILIELKNMRNLHSKRSDEICYPLMYNHIKQKKKTFHKKFFDNKYPCLNVKPILLF